MLFFNDPSPKFRKLIPNISKDMEDFIDSKQFIKGKSLDLLEKKLSDYLEVDEFFGCANGTDAITIALLASNSSLSMSFDICISPSTCSFHV